MKKLIPILLLWITGLLLMALIFILPSCSSSKDVHKTEVKQQTSLSQEDSLKMEYLKKDTSELRRQIREMEFLGVSFQQCPEVDTAAFRKLFSKECPPARVDSAIKAITPKTSKFKKDKDGNFEIEGALKSIQYAKTRLEDELSTQRSTTAFMIDQLIKTNLQQVTQKKEVEKHKESHFMTGFGWMLTIGIVALIVGFIIGWRARKMIKEVDNIQPNNMKNLITVFIACLLLASCGKSKVPSNEIVARSAIQNGWDIVDKSTDPVPHIDSLYYTEPTWQQANYLATQRGDHSTWNWLGVLAIAITLFWFVGVGTNYISWFPKVNTVFAGIFSLALLGAILYCFKHQSADIKWNNKVEITKDRYEYLMKRDGSIQAFWDSLEINCALRWGPYKCFQK